MNSSEATERFRRAEQSSRRKGASLYAYIPPSTDAAAAPPLSQRLNTLRHELAALEAEAQTSFTTSATEEELNSSELVRELSDMRTRLERVGSSSETRKKVLKGITPKPSHTEGVEGNARAGDNADHERKIKNVHEVSDMDRRLGDLEKVLGSSATTLDEVSFDALHAITQSIEWHCRHSLYPHHFCPCIRV